MYRMLIVDDEKIERNGLCGLVRRFGYPFEVLQAANGRQAVKLLRREAVDVLITDIRMPLMDGLELTAWVRENYPGIHVVVASAYDDFTYAQKAISLQVSEYLLKPVDIEQFQIMMAHVLKLCETDAVDRMHEEELREYRLIKREEALWDLLYTPPDKEYPHEALNYYQETFSRHQVIPVLAETHGLFFDTREQLLEKNITELWPWPHELYVPEEDQAVILLHEARAIPENELETAAHSLLERMRRLTHCELFITVGRAAASPRELSESLREAEERSGYKFFIGRGCVVFSKNGYLASADTDSLIDGLTQSLMEDIHYAEFDKAADRLELLLHTLEKSRGLSVLYIKNLFAELLRKAVQKTYPPLPGDVLEEMLHAVMDSNSIYELKEYIAEQLHIIARRIGGEERQTTAHRAVNEAIAIIREQYTDPALSMESLAKKTYLSPSYFSSVFKAETGESTTHFLARYRLERARELLEKTGIKVTDIGARVGFSSASYFVTVFRGAYGMSPTQYREQYLSGRGRGKSDGKMV